MRICDREERAVMLVLKRSEVQSNRRYDNTLDSNWSGRKASGYHNHNPERPYMAAPHLSV